MFINLYNAFPFLSLFFSASILFCVFNSIYGFNHCDWLNLIRNALFSVLILVSSKVVSSHESHTYLYKKKLGANFLTLLIGILYKWAIFNWYRYSVTSLIYISSSRIHYFELLLVYLFKSCSFCSIHLNPLLGRNWDTT